MWGKDWQVEPLLTSSTLGVGWGWALWRVRGDTAEPRERTARVGVKSTTALRTASER